MDFIFLFLMSTFLIVVVIYNVTKDKIIKKNTIAEFIIPLIILLFCIVDMFFWCSGGICKITDLERIFSLSRNPSTYTFTLLSDDDGKIYFASQLCKANFFSKGEAYKSIRVTYLPCTRTIIKLEQRPEDSYSIPIIDTSHISDDGYRELYEYSKDTLPVSIFANGVVLIVVLIVKIRIESRRRD